MNKGRYSMVRHAELAIGIGSCVRVWCPHWQDSSAWHNTAGTVIRAGHPVQLHWGLDNRYHAETTFVVQDAAGDERQFFRDCLIPISNK